MSVVTPLVPPTRRNVELVLLLFAIAVAEAAYAIVGLTVQGAVPQVGWLVGGGLAILVQETDPEITLSRLKSTSAVHRLISPAEMGELFKVLALGKGVEGPLLGFQSARPLSL